MTTTTDEVMVAAPSLAPPDRSVFLALDAGWRWGFEAGYDAGTRDAEADLADAWAGEVRRVKAALGPDRPDARIAAAERYWRTVAERLYADPAAWDSAARAGTMLAPDGRALWRSGAELRRDVERRTGLRVVS